MLCSSGPRVYGFPGLGTGSRLATSRSLSQQCLEARWRFGMWGQGDKASRVLSSCRHRVGESGKVFPFKASFSAFRKKVCNAEIPTCENALCGLTTRNPRRTPGQSQQIPRNPLIPEPLRKETVARWSRLRALTRTHEKVRGKLEFVRLLSTT